MSKFSELTKYYVHKKDIQVQAMGQYCELDRSTMYKIINGKRNPASIEAAGKIADFMELTPSEKQQLMEAYYILTLGEATYYRRKNLEDFFLHFPDNTIKHTMSPFVASKDSILDAFKSTNTPLQNKVDIQRVVYQMLVQETLKPQGSIQMIVQPSWNYLFELLQALSNQKVQLKIEHILCLPNRETIDYENKDYSISYLHAIVGLFQTNANYLPRYYYDNIESHFLNLNLFPYLIVTSDYALQCTTDLHNAILYQNPDTIRMLSSIFKTQYQQTSLLFKKTPFVPEEYLSVFVGGSDSQNTTWQLGAHPCLTTLLDRKLAEKYIAKAIPQRELFIEGLVAHGEKTRALLEAGKLRLCISDEGLCYFLKHGKTKEYPACLYDAVQKEDLLVLLERLEDDVKCGYVRILSGALEKLPLNVGCMINAHTGKLLTYGGEGMDDMVYLVLEERNLFHSFLDYISHMEEAGALMEVERAGAYLEKIKREVGNEIVHRESLK